jgi:hypothetical protein
VTQLSFDQRPAAPRQVLLCFLAVLLAWAVAQWLWVRPEAIGASWRECDTQAIARNFSRYGVDLLRPRIDWGGDGPGYVESEMPLYTAGVALLLQRFGEVEWPGQFLSLLALAGTSLALALGTRRRLGNAPAALAGLALLGSQLGVSLSVSVMPDASALLGFTLGWLAFLRFAELGRSRDLWLSGAATLLAAWVKAPALQLGLAQFLLLALAHRERLKRFDTWLVWALVLLGAAAQLWQARQLFLETGLTFGVLSGGDTKFPSAGHLLMPGLYLDLLEMALRFGPGLVGLLALLALLLWRRLAATEFALLASYGLGVVVSMRYSHSPDSGAHYHVFGALLGAWLVGRAAAVATQSSLGWRGPRLFAAATLGLVLVPYLGHALLERDWRANVRSASTVRLAKLAAAHSRPGDLLVVRSPKPTRDPFWQRRNNFEEPTVLYLADRRGWVLPADAVFEQELPRFGARGARLFVDSRPAPLHPLPPAPAAQLVHAGPEGSLWRLEASEPPSGPAPQKPPLEPAARTEH